MNEALDCETESFSDDSPLLSAAFTSTVPFLALQSDRAVSLVSGAVDTWTDLTGNGNSAAFNGARPSLHANAIAPGIPGILFDGTSQSMKMNFTRPAPGTTPTFFCGVMRFTGTNPTNNGKSLSGSSNYAIFRPTAGSMDTRVYDGVNTVIEFTPVAGQWCRMRLYFSGSTNDLFWLGSGRHSGTSFGVLAEPGAFWLGGVNGSFFDACEWGALLGFNALPTPTELAAFDVLCTAWGKGSIQL